MLEEKHVFGVSVAPEIYLVAHRASPVLVKILLYHLGSTSRATRVRTIFLFSWAFQYGKPVLLVFGDPDVSEAHSHAPSEQPW